MIEILGNGEWNNRPTYNGASPVVASSEYPPEFSGLVENQDELIALRLHLPAAPSLGDDRPLEDSPLEGPQTLEEFQATGAKGRTFEQAMWTPNQITINPESECFSPLAVIGGAVLNCVIRIPDAPSLYAVVTTAGEQGGHDAIHNIVSLPITSEDTSIGRVEYSLDHGRQGPDKSEGRTIRTLPPCEDESGRATEHVKIIPAPQCLGAAAFTVVYGESGTKHVDIIARPRH